MIRISIREEDSRTMVRIDGRLVSADMDEIRRIQQSLYGKVVLELEGLDACGEDGIRLLRDWLSNGAQLAKAAPFLRMLLEHAERRSP